MTRSKQFNPASKPLEFEGFRKDVGLNSFTMSPSKWIDGVNAIGMVVQSGRYGGTYARNDIAIHQMRVLSSDTIERKLLK